MFKHQVKMQLKTGSLPLLSQKIENTILPLLNKQKGYCNSNVFVTRQHTTATEDTFWNTREDAEQYQRSGYLKVLETLSEVVTTLPSAVISEASAQN